MKYQTNEARIPVTQKDDDPNASFHSEELSSDDELASATFKLKSKAVLDRAMTKLGSSFKKIEGISEDNIKEYTLLASMGLDDLIPKQFQSHFSRSDSKVDDVFKDQVNEHGFGNSFIDEIRRKYGLAFAMLLKDAKTRGSYVQR